MQVTPILDRNDPSRSYVRVNDIPAVFPKHTDTPEVGKPLEVMITGVHYHVMEDGTFDTSRPKMLFIRPITNYYVKVTHTGFMKNTLGNPVAYGLGFEPQGDNQLRILTPGRIEVYTAYCADARVMSSAFVRRKDIDRSIIRIEGVPDIEDLHNPTSFY